MATITTIESTDVVADSRAVINTNFSNLNNDKQEKATARTDLSGGTALTVGTHYYDTLSANRTLTFSGTPAEGSRTSVVLVVSNTPTLTIPSSKRVGGDNTAITSLAMVDGVQVVSWEYRNSEWLVADTLAVSDLPAVISQAEAEAGTDTNSRLVTAERIAQAIAALGTSKATWGTLTGTTPALTFTAAEQNRTFTLSGDTTFTASGYAQGRRINIFITADGSTRTLTFPAGWVWLESAPANVAASKNMKIELICTGSNEADVRAVYGVQA